MTTLRSLHRFLAARGVYASVLLSSACVAALAGRFWLSGNELFAFLAVNLALAWIPFVLGLLALALHRAPRAAPAALLLVPGWWLFLPNAPYLLSDLVHLRERAPVPHWYDLGLMLLFGGTGLFLAVASLGHVRDVLATLVGRTVASTTIVTAALSCGLGIYLGRFLRWNSWDLLVRPRPLLRDLADRLLSPAEHPATWGVTLLFGGIVLVAYLVVPAAPPHARG